MEEAILRYRDRFGENTEFSVTAARQRYTGRPYIQIELEEEAYNPLSGDASEIYDWSGSLLTAVGLHPQYSYSNGKNVLKVILPNQTRNMPKRAAAAIILGIIIGFIGSGLS
ncbi:MAG: hypothetical protein IKR78_02255, partial [Dehalococcoidales bacterium]|nr:hypothetical protein [Dehalococcoidales bacterium]